MSKLDPGTSGDGKTRRDFLLRDLPAGALVLLRPGLRKHLSPAGAGKEESVGRKHMVSWIQALLGGLEENTDSQTAIRVLEECGRDCARGSSFFRQAEKYRDDVDGFLARFGSLIGPGNVTREGNRIRVVYEKCFCHLLNPDPAPLPKTFCNCSRGWLMEMFRAVTGNQVEVTLIGSIRSGAPRCEFTIELPPE